MADLFDRFKVDGQGGGGDLFDRLSETPAAPETPKRGGFGLTFAPEREVAATARNIVQGAGHMLGEMGQGTLEMVEQRWHDARARRNDFAGLDKYIRERAGLPEAPPRRYATDTMRERAERIDAGQGSALDIALDLPRRDLAALQRATDIPEGHWAERDNFVQRDVAQGLGSFAAIGGVRAVSGLPGTLVGVAGMGRREFGEDADRFDADPEVRETAARIGEVVGLTQVVPLEVALGRLRRAGGEGLFRHLKDAALTGVSEAALEAFFEFAKNQTAGELGYDPDRDPMQNVAHAAQVGGVVGATAHLLMAMMGVRGGGMGRLRQDRPEPQPEAPPPEPAAAREEEPEIVVRSNGEPFPTREAAETAARARGIEGREVVEVSGGWGLRRAPAQPAIDSEAAPEAAPVYEGGIDFTTPPRPEPSVEPGAAPQGLGLQMPAVDFTREAPDLTAETRRDAARRVARDERIQALEERLGEVAMPEGLTDPRLKREDFRVLLPRLAGELVKGGNVAYLTDEHGTITGRTPSMNPQWFQSMAENPETSVTVEQAQRAVQKALAGERLGVREARVVSVMLDQITGERTDPQNIAAVRAQLEAARAVRALWPEGSVAPEQAEAEIARAGERFEEQAYNPEWDGETRALYELLNEAAAFNPDAVQAIVDRDAPTHEAARDLWAIIQEGRRGAETAETAQPIQPQEPAAAGGREAARGPAPGLPAQAAPAEQVTPERRQDAAARKRVDQMSPAEMRAALLTDPLTGLPNRRAYEESAKRPVQVFIDLDSLKWVNDNLGHGAGDQLLAAMGQALRESGLDAYHLSGDEFIVQADDAAAVKAELAQVEARLAGAVIEAQTPEGDTIRKTGVGFSYGIGGTAHEADTALNDAKSDREARGLRVGRGQEPGGVARIPARGQPDHESDAPAEITPPRQEATAPQEAPADAGVSGSAPILRNDGQPFQTRRAAELAARARADLKGRAMEAVEVEGGWGLAETAASRTDVQSPAAEADARIAKAEADGVALSDADKTAVRSALKEAADLRARANRLVGASSDPMGKGDAFPLGVGFTKMTRRKERALDASVTKAGEAVKLFNRAKTAEQRAADLLAGKGTESDAATKKANREKARREIVARILRAKKGDKLGPATVERVSMSRDGYPSSVTISGEGIIKGVTDKLDIAREFFGGDAAALRAAVDAVRAEETADAVAPTEQAATLEEARRVVRDGRQGKLKQSLLRSAIEAAEVGRFGTLEARLNASKEAIARQSEKGSAEEQVGEAEIERLAQAVANDQTSRQIRRELESLEASRGRGTSSDLAWGTGGGGNYIRRLRVLERALEISESDAVRAEAGQGESAPTSEPRSAEKAPSQAKIDDLGEKIGGARKDTSVKARPKTGKASQSVPAWRKRFVAVQDMTDTASGNEAWLIVDTRTGKPMRGSDYRSMRFDTQEAAEKALPLVAVAVNHGVYSDRDGRYSVWRKIGDRRRVQVIPETFATPDEAMRHMAQHATDILETKLSFGEEVLPTPEKVYRYGADRRKGDVAGQDFMDTFGFRGVEFGNWNNQAERQEVMNHTYDALLDLAEVLNVPPKALSLNGDLALAFGARGQGLTGAKAHYEPSYAVINLTKMQGAGSLAHEWLHSLDHYFARLDGAASSERVTNERGDRVFKDGRHTFASHGFLRDSKARQELRDAYRALIDTMFNKAETFVEDTQKADQFVAKARETLKEQLDRIRTDLAQQKDPRYWKRNNKPAAAEQLARFDELADALVNGERLDLEYRKNEGGKSRFGSARMSNDVLDEMAGIYKAVRGRSGFNAQQDGVFDNLRGYIVNYRKRIQMLKDANAGAEKVKKVPTDFYKQAVAADQVRVKSDYWSSPHEMAARAFAAYVEDKLAENSARNDFLAYHAHGAVLVPVYPEGLFRPYPEGAERVAINQAFERLFDVIETRETDQGVAMFSRRGPARSPWPADFPDAVILHDAAAVQAHADYRAAKDGDTDAAYRLVRAVVGADQLDTLRRAIGKRKPVVVGVHAEEAVSVNKIPLAYADHVGDALGLDVDVSIVQAQKIGRGGADGFYRLANTPTFVGEVQAGRDYLLLDDTLTQGGTFAALRAHIEAGGGRVVLASTLMGKQYSAKLSPSPEALARVRERHGQDFESWWKRTFGYGLDALTESELRYLATVKVPSTDALRDRILAARQAGDAGAPARTEGEGRGGPPLASRTAATEARPTAGLSVSGVEQVADLLRRGWKGAPPVNVVAREADLPAAIARQIEAEGAQGTVRGVFHDGQVYLVAENLTSQAEAAETLLHEVVGHYGLRTLLGKDLEPVLNQVWLAYGGRKGFKDIIDAYFTGGEAFDPANRNHRLLVAEERLAHMVQSGEKPSLLKRLYGLVREWLRRMGFQIPMADADIAHLLQRAREVVVQGDVSQAPAGLTAFARNEEARFSRRAPDQAADSASESADRPFDYGSDRKAPAFDDMPKIESHVENLARLRGVFDSASDVLRRQPGLAHVADAVNEFFDRTRVRMGEVNGRIRPAVKAVKKLPRAEREAAYGAFERYFRARENGRAEEAAAVRAETSPEAQRLIEVWEQVADYSGRENQAVGVKVFDPKIGKWRPIGKLREFFPRTLKPEVQRALTNPSKEPDTWARMVDALMADGYISDPAEAGQYVRNYFAKETANDYFAGIEKARGEPLPEFFYDYSWDAAMLYKDKWAERVSQIEAFGQRDADGADVFSKAIESTLDERTKVYLQQVAERVYNVTAQDPTLAFVGSLNVLATGLQLGNPATALLNLIGGTSLNFQAYGVRHSMVALGKELVGLGAAIDDATAKGILVEDYLTIMHDAQQQGVSRKLSKFATGMLKWGGYTPAEVFIRSHAMLTGQQMLRDALKQWNRKIDSRRSLNYIAWFQRNGFDYQKLLAEAGAGPQTDRFLRYAVNLTQGSYRVNQTPVFVDTPIGRFLFKYQKFGTQLSRMFWINHLKPFVETLKGGERVRYEKDGELREARVRTFMPMARFFGVAFGAGSLLAFLREALFAYNDPGPGWDELEKALEDDEKAMALGLMMARFWHSIMAVGALGFFGNYVQMLKDVADRQRVKSPLDPPALAPLKGTGEAMMRFWEQDGRLTARDIDDIAAQQVSLYRTGKRATLKGLSTITDLREAQLEAARRDRAYVRKLTRRYAAEAGIEGKRRAPDRIGATAMTPTNRRITEALLLGDAATAQSIVREHLATLETREDMDRALASIRGAVRAYQPARVSIAPSAAERASFLAWAEGRVGDANYQRLLRIDQQYTEAAVAAGILPRERPGQVRRQARQRERDREPLTERQQRQMLRRFERPIADQ